MALRLRHVPHERRACRAAGLHLPARAATSPSITPPASSSRRASPTWSGPISTRARTAGRSSRSSKCVIPSTLDDTLAPHGPACREPVLPARRAGIAGRRVVGRSSRDGRRPDDRDGRPLCAELQALGARPADHVSRSISSARSGSSAATSFTARSISSRCSRRARCSGMRTIAGRCPGLYMCGSGTHPGGGVTGAAGAQCGEGSAEGFEEALQASLILTACKGERREGWRSSSAFDGAIHSRRVRFGLPLQDEV